MSKARLSQVVVVALSLSAAAVVDAAVREHWSAQVSGGVLQMGDATVEVSGGVSDIELGSWNGVFRAFTSGTATFTAGGQAFGLQVNEDTSLALETPAGTLEVGVIDLGFDGPGSTLLIGDAALMQRIGEAETTDVLNVGTLTLSMQLVLLDSQVVLPGSGGAIDLPEICDPANSGPDVIVGELPNFSNYTNGSSPINGYRAYSIGTTSCNLGDQPLGWYNDISGAGADPDPTNHPVIAQNIYRLRTVSGATRFDQIGQSWLKHGFFALSGNLCCSCNGTDGDTLGTGCSDPYNAGLNGNQVHLGPRSHVNPTDGEFPYPFDSNLPPGYTQPPACSGPTSDICRRIQVLQTDITNQPAGTLYFAEGHYIAPDDALAGNDNNNASYRRVTFGSASPFNLSSSVAFPTEREKAGIIAWADNDPGVSIKHLDIAGDGRMTVGYKVTDLGGGLWHYEYCVYNMYSDRAGQAVSIPVPPGVVLTNVEFHDVDSHSGEPYSTTDWTFQQAGGAATWSTQTFATNANANALRWGTMYSFRFDANTEPTSANGTITLFKPATESSPDTAVTFDAVAPSAPATSTVDIVAANPPRAADNPYLPGEPFCDVLDTGTTSALTAGIGADGTLPHGPIGYAPISVTFSGAPSPAPNPANVTLECTGGLCPTVTSVTAPGGNTYLIGLSGAIPPGECTTITFAGTNAGQKLQYQSLPGDATLNGSTNTQDLLGMIQAINNGAAALPVNAARFNLNRMGDVNAQDLLRLVQLLNGVNTTQPFNAVTRAACP